MKEEKIKLDDKEYIVKEIKYKDLAGMGEVSQTEAAKKMMQLAVEISDEEYEELSMSAGIKIQKIINELNGLADFQEPQSPK